jgi:hypothetical protein
MGSNPTSRTRAQVQCERLVKKMTFINIIDQDTFMNKNVLGIVSISLLLAVVVFRFLITIMYATEQSSSQIMNEILLSIVGFLITFGAIFFVIQKFGSKIKLLSNRMIAILFIIISLVILFL